MRSAPLFSRAASCRSFPSRVGLFPSCDVPSRADATSARPTPRGTPGDNARHLCLGDVARGSGAAPSSFHQEVPSVNARSDSGDMGNTFSLVMGARHALERVLGRGRISPLHGPPAQQRDDDRPNAAAPRAWPTSRRPCSGECPAPAMPRAPTMPSLRPAGSSPVSQPPSAASITALGTHNGHGGCVATSGLRRQDGPPLASTVPGPPSCPATIRSNGASSNPPSSSSAFGGTCGMP